MPTKTEKNSPTLETAMQRVSEIVASMEGGDMPLEKLIDSYEEGIGLAKSCQEKLDAAKLQADKAAIEMPPRSASKSSPATRAARWR